jgi:hypothetical protein
VVAVFGASLTVFPGDWGEAPVTEIELLLRSVQQNFFGAFPKPPPNKLEVRRSSEDIYLDFRPRPRDPVRIYLNVKDRYWSQFSYQFAHELCHLACNYERFQTVNNQPHPWMWFQEAICETASLFTLRKMTVNWQKNPPNPIWKEYAPQFSSYAQKLIEDPQRQLTNHIPLADWYATNRLLLATNATLRPLNGTVANRLLPLFEATPHAWQAVRFLPDTRGTITEYLQAWLARTPRKYTPVIRLIAREFQVTL